MAIYSIQQGYLSYSAAPLLDHVELHIESGERLCLVGRNGAGKSTLMKVISGEVLLDDGAITHLQDLKIARLEQDPPQTESATVYDYVADGVAELGKILADYHHQLTLLADQHDDERVMRRLSELQEQLDQQQGWQFDTRISQILSLLSLTADTLLSDLSGGWLRKVALARALVNEPDLLLLDEPTNHLDIDSIAWLEDFLRQYKGAIVFISHDREFIQRMATRIVDLDRGVLTSWPGNYDAYLSGKEEWLRVEELKNAQFDKKLAQEEVWIRQGVKARRTRNEGRVRALKALRMERGDRREKVGTSKIQLDEAVRSGKIIFEGEGVNYSIEGKSLIRNFDFRVMRGDKIALIGPNGCGKTTLANMLSRFLIADTGRIAYDGVDINDLDLKSLRSQIALVSQDVVLFNGTIMDNIAYGELSHHSREDVERAAKMANAWQFIEKLPQGLDTLIGENGTKLSGGQRQRIAIARALLKNAPILILDEATSALDNESERLVQAALEQLMQARTTIVIAHRLSTIEQADLIVVMDNGQVVEQGTHTELMQKQGRYAHLHSAQLIKHTPE